MKSLENELLLALAMLRRHINPLQSPTYRLPSELLPLVASNLESDTDLVRATHVSHHWRNTLFSHPSLWSHLDFEDTGRALAFLEKSKSTPLHVTLVGDIPVSPSVESLGPHTTRIVTLVMFDCEPQWALLSQPVPSLRRLEIVGADEPPVDGTISLSLPSVTSLALHDVYPTPLHVPHLVCFKFRYSVLNGDVTMAELLLNFLLNCPLLEDLEVSHAFSFVSTRDQAVQLLNLRSFIEITLHEGVYAFGVLEALSFPPSCSVTLKSWTHSYVKVEPTSILPQLKNPQCLAGVMRVKLSTTLNPSNHAIHGILELINDKGVRVCLERALVIGGPYQPLFVQEGADDNLNLAHLNCLKDLDARSAEILCVEGYGLWAGDPPAADLVKEVFYNFGSITTLILSHTTVEPCLLALDSANTGAGNGAQGLPQIQTLIIHSSTWEDPSDTDILQTLLPVARKRKAAGNPFNSVLVFLPLAPGPELREEEVEELRSCIGNFEIATGDDILDWDIDKYFLDGLEHLQNRRNVQWDLSDDMSLEY